MPPDWVSANSSVGKRKPSIWFSNLRRKRARSTCSAADSRLWSIACASFNSSRTRARRRSNPAGEAVSWRVNRSTPARGRFPQERMPAESALGPRAGFERAFGEMAADEFSDRDLGKWRDRALPGIGEEPAGEGRELRLAEGSAGGLPAEL